MKTTIAYKVVTNTNISTFAPTNLVVSYELNKTTKPRVAGCRLFVFATQEEAERYARCFTKIFKCEVTSARSVEFIQQTHTIAEIKEHCKGNYVKEVKWSFVTFKTMLAVTSVKPIELIP